MKTRLNSMTVSIALFTVFSIVSALAAQAGQTPAAAGQRGAGGAGRGGGRGNGQPAVPAGPAPRLPNGKPDLSGIWSRPYTPDMTRALVQTGAGTGAATGGRGGAAAKLPYTDWGLKNAPVAEGGTYDPANGDYTGSCMPFGFIRSINSPWPMQIMQNNDYIALLFEQNSWFVVIPTDGRPHNVEEVGPRWFGNSVGHWEGDTMVIDTIGFNGYTRLDTVGHPHSDKLHLIQKFTRTDANTIAYSITIEDPKTYTQSWTQSRNFTATKDQIMEYSCEENNKDLYDGVIKPWRPPVE